MKSNLVLPRERAKNNSVPRVDIKRDLYNSIRYFFMDVAQDKDSLWWELSDSKLVKSSITKKGNVTTYRVETNSDYNDFIDTYSYLDIKSLFKLLDGGSDAVVMSDIRDFYYDIFSKYGPDWNKRGEKLDITFNANCYDNLKKQRQMYIEVVLTGKFTPEERLDVNRLFSMIPKAFKFLTKGAEINNNPMKIVIV